MKKESITSTITAIIFLICSIIAISFSLNKPFLFIFFLLLHPLSFLIFLANSYKLDKGWPKLISKIILSVMIILSIITLSTIFILSINSPLSWITINISTIIIFFVIIIAMGIEEYLIIKIDRNTSKTLTKISYVILGIITEIAILISITYIFLAITELMGYSLFTF